jgi:hypothetical protein
VRATSDVVAHFSDLRLKDIVGLIENSLEKVLKLNGVYYNYSDKAVELGYEPTEERFIGLIAQEVKDNIPEAVTLAPIDTNASGGSISGENYLTVMYSKVIPLIIEALKEQKDQIDYIRSKI